MDIIEFKESKTPISEAKKEKILSTLKKIFLGVVLTIVVASAVFIIIQVLKMFFALAVIIVVTCGPRRRW